MNNRKIKIIQFITQQEQQDNQQAIENNTYQAYNIPTFQYQNQNPQQSQNSGVKIKQDIKINQERLGYFESLCQSVSADINNNNNHQNLYPYAQNDSTISQFWKFEFMGKGNFQGRQISGILKLQADHPLSAPMFYFDPIQTDKGPEVLQHENIYGDHSLCIPLFTIWKNTTKEQDMLEAIEDIFHNPNWSKSDAPANPIFANQPDQIKKEIQIRQAQFLPFFEKNQ